jgi:hypothetical protein
MTLIEAAALEVIALLDDLRLRYMVIGGIAVGLWGEPRVTLDLDVSVWVEPERFEATVDLLSSRLRLRTSQPMEMARRDRVLPALASNGVPVDLLFAAWPVERRAFDRSVSLRIGSLQIRVAPLDYLVFLKLISERPKDLADAGLDTPANRAAAWSALAGLHAHAGHDGLGTLWYENRTGGKPAVPAEPSWHWGSAGIAAFAARLVGWSERSPGGGSTG